MALGADEEIARRHDSVKAFPVRQREILVDAEAEKATGADNKYW